jgi:hypothetical protein
MRTTAAGSAWAAHLALVKMNPEGEGPERRYRASGAFNLSTILKEASGKSGSGGEIYGESRGIVIPFEMALRPSAVAA